MRFVSLISLHFAVKFCIHVSVTLPLCELKEELAFSLNTSHTDPGPATITSPTFTVLLSPVV